MTLSTLRLLFAAGWLLVAMVLFVYRPVDFSHSAGVMAVLLGLYNAVRWYVGRFRPAPRREMRRRAGESEYHPEFDFGREP